MTHSTFHSITSSPSHVLPPPHPLSSSSQPLHSFFYHVAPCTSPSLQDFLFPFKLSFSPSSSSRHASALFFPSSPSPLPFPLICTSFLYFSFFSFHTLPLIVFICFLLSPLKYCSIQSCFLLLSLSSSLSPCCCMEDDELETAVTAAITVAAAQRKTVMKRGSEK